MLTFHWKAPLQPKGFLKIVELLVAILAFSLVAGFTATSTVECQQTSLPTSAVIKTKYPFFTFSFTPTIEDRTVNVTSGSFGQHIISGQLFVAWGVLTMLYCITAIVVYILFTANENLEKVVDLLIYVDLGFHVVWVLGWFIASVDWAVGFNGIRRQLNNQLTGWAFLQCNNKYNLQSDTFVQASIADVFGFLSLFLWMANIYWVLIDTAWFIKLKAQRAHQQF